MQKSLHHYFFHTILLIFWFWNTCEPTYASFCHSKQHFSLLHLTSMLLLLNVFQKTNGAAYLMEIIASLLSHAVMEGDWTRRTVWTQTILTERRWNGDGMETWRIVWIGPYTAKTLLSFTGRLHGLLSQAMHNHTHSMPWALKIRDSINRPTLPARPIHHKLRNRASSEMSVSLVRHRATPPLKLIVIEMFVAAPTY